jgi:carboxypeptidase family protein/TonB-dependent receptor-like protein
MARLSGLVAAAAALVGLTFGAAFAQTGPVPAALRTARLSFGGIQGTVIDEHGAPVSGAMVSALGGMTSGMAITDGRGRYVIDPLPAGEYVLRIHVSGFASARHENVHVGTARANVDAIRIRRVDTNATATARPVLTASVAAAPSEKQPKTGDEADDDHSETAWRLRHIKRSILKDEGSAVSIADAAAGQSMPPSASSLFDRAFDNAASFFTETPFSGEVNLLTTSAIGGGSLYSNALVPRGVAYLSIGAPAASGRWDVRASMSQSEVAAWIVAGSFASRIASTHDYGFGFSYATQQYQSQAGVALPLGAEADESRTVGELYGSDHWTISPALAVEYSARYGRYDYLRQRSLFSPRVAVSVTPLDGTHITATAAERMLAPGAEEFLAPTIVGPWLPPERTFAPVVGDVFHVERARFLDLGIEHEFDDAYVIGIRRFQQTVINQQAALFGIPVASGPQSPGHYFVANAGAVDADGWAVRVSTSPLQRIRGSFDYSVTRAHWLARGDVDAIAVLAPAVIRPKNEDVHDLTTSIETDIPETSTRVFLLYKVNNAFARGDDSSRPTFDSRFDVQVNQALPFMPFSSARWEVLVGLRNLFRDPNDSGSIYDELLVIRPPKRVIGGFLVRF